MYEQDCDILYIDKKLNELTEEMLLIMFTMQYNTDTKKQASPKNCSKQYCQEELK